MQSIEELLIQYIGELIVIIIIIGILCVCTYETE